MEESLERRPRGISMVEVMISIALMFAIFSSVTLLSLGMTTLGTARGDTLAASLATQILNSVRTMNFSDIPTGVFDGRIPTGPNNPGASNQFPPQPYPLSVVTYVNNGVTNTHNFKILVSSGTPLARDGVTLLTDVKTINVQVFWTEDGGVAKSLSNYTAVQQEAGL